MALLISDQVTGLPDFKTIPLRMPLLLPRQLACNEAVFLHRKAPNPSVWAFADIVNAKQKILLKRLYKMQHIMKLLYNYGLTYDVLRKQASSQVFNAGKPVWRFVYLATLCLFTFIRNLSPRSIEHITYL